MNHQLNYERNVEIIIFRQVKSEIDENGNILLVFNLRRKFTIKLTDRVLAIYCSHTLGQLFTEMLMEPTHNIKIVNSVKDVNLFKVNVLNDENLYVYKQVINSLAIALIPTVNDELLKAVPSAEIVYIEDG